MNLKISKEFEELIPPLTIEEEENLENSLKKEGCRDALVVWNGTIVDGHHRYKICKKYNIPFEVVEMDFEDVYDVKLWIIENQLARRNLIKAQRIELGLKYEDILREKAKKNQGTRTDLLPNLAKSLDPVNTREKVAKLAGVSHGTVDYMKKILKYGDPTLISKVETGEESIYGVYKEIKKMERQKEAQVIKEERKKVEDSLKDVGIDIQLGDFRDLIKNVKDNSIDLILTDPPYPKEYLYLYEALAMEAKRVLKPSGFLISYSGQTYLPEVMKYLGGQLDYFWLAGLNHLGKKQIVFQKNVSCRMKPILIYQKPPMKKPHQFCDLIDSPAPNKELDKWQQSVEPFITLLDRFSEPNDLILDPFCGTGTIPWACKLKKRKCIAYEIEEEKYLISIKRCSK